MEYFVQRLNGPTTWLFTLPHAMPTQGGLDRPEVVQAPASHLFFAFGLSLLILGQRPPATKSRYLVCSAPGWTASFIKSRPVSSAGHPVIFAHAKSAGSGERDLRAVICECGRHSSRRQRASGEVNADDVPSDPLV